MRLPLLFLLASLSPALADDDRHERDDDDDHGYDEGRAAARAAPSAAPSPEATLYARECGSCHVAYPPALLPARSWQAIMANLGDHSGEVATPDPTPPPTLSAWLAGGAGDRLPGGPARGIARIPPTETPLRITTLSWFRGEHDEIPTSWVRDNPEVKSFSACAACHADAAAGRFDEHRVSVPGHGRWDD